MKRLIQFACFAALTQAFACQSVSRDPDHSIFGERGSTPHPTPCPTRTRRRMHGPAS
jgi:hypothetical protein